MDELPVTEDLPLVDGLPVTEPEPGATFEARRPRAWVPGLSHLHGWTRSTASIGRVGLVNRVGRSGGRRPDPGTGARALLAVLLAATQVVGSLLLAPLQPDRVSPDTPLAGVLLLAGPAALVATRRPVPRAVVATAAASAYLASGYAIGPVLLGAGFALVAAVLAGCRAEAWLVAGAGLVGAVAVSRLGGTVLPVLPAVQWAGWVAALLALAELVRARRDADQVWSRARAQLRLRQAAEARVEVARDRIDEAVHEAQLIRAGAGAVLSLLEPAAGPPDGTDPLEPFRADLLEPFRADLVALRDCGDRVLAELRVADELLTMQGEAVPSVATPGLAALPELASRWAGAGLLVRAAGDPGALPPDVDQVALRVVQEALANVARHSRSDHADLALHRDADQLTVLISDPGPPQPCPPGPVPTSADLLIDPDLFAGEFGTVFGAEFGTVFGAEFDADLGHPRGGRGLDRLHERVSALGGAVSAGPDGDGWCVHVVLPAGPAC